MLLRAFPAGYRDAHGAEMVGTLMEASASGRRVPSLREAAGLVTGGFAVRARRAVERPVSWWVDGLHLGVCVLAVVNLTYALADFTGEGDAYWGWIAGSVALVLAVLRELDPYADPHTRRAESVRHAVVTRCPYAAGEARSPARALPSSG